MESVKKKKAGLYRRKELIFVTVMMAIPVLNFIVFWIGINLNSILFAFQIVDPVTMGTKFSLDNFVMFFHDFELNGVLLLALKNTMIFFTSGLIISLPGSFLMCYFLYKKVFCYKFFRFVFYLPSIISPAVLVVLFKQIISAKGPLGVLIYNNTGSYFPFLTDDRYALLTILLYSLLISFGSNIVLLSGGLSQIDSTILEAAEIDGAGMATELFKILLPLTWPTLSTLVLFAFVGMFGASGDILLFTKGSYKTTTLSYWLYEQVYYSNSYYYPSAVGLIMTLVGTPIALGIRALNNKLVTF